MFLICNSYSWELNRKKYRILKDLQRSGDGDLWAAKLVRVKELVVV